MTSLSPIELTRLEPVVASNFLPNERLLWMCREDPKRIVVRQAWRFLVPIGLLALLFGIRGVPVTLMAILLFSFSLLLFFGVMLSIRMRTAFAISDHRIVILSLPEGKIKGWVNLDKVSGIEIANRGDRIGDLKIHFSSRPSGARRSLKGRATSTYEHLPITEFALEGIEEPEQLKALIDSIPRKP
jgi:hypothetical protein